MRKFITISLLAITGISATTAQESWTYGNADRDFYDGKELQNQGKWAISERYIERFLDKRSKSADPDLVQEAKYYKAVNAYKMEKEYAETLINEYLKEYPYNPHKDRCLFMSGNIAFRNKQYNKAMERYGEVKKRRLPDAEQDEMTFNSGYCHLQKDEYSQAKGNFKSLKSGKSKYKNSATYYYSYCNYATKDYDAALSGFLAIEDQVEFKDFVPFYIAQIYYKQKDYDKLMPYCDSLANSEKTSKTPSSTHKNENMAEVYRILGECAYEKGDYTKTIAAMTDYEKKSKKIVREDAYILGMSYFKTEDYANAVKRLQKVTTEKDTLAQNAYLHLGHSYNKLKQQANARMAYREASKMDFDKKVQEEAAYNYCLATYETTTPFDESITAFNNFLEKYPNSAYADDVREREVSVYLATRNYATANEQLSKIKNLSPRMKDAKAYILFQLGTENFVKEDYAEAVKYFNESEATGTQDFDVAQVIYWRGESKYRQGDNVSARKDMMQFFGKRGADNFADKNLANYTIGYTYFKEKNYKEAPTYYLRYVNGETNTKKATFTDACNRLGDCYYAQRDLVNAERYYTKSMENGGSDADYATFQRAYVQGLRKNYSSKIKGLNGLIRNFPGSEYVDDAYYEIGRANIMQDNENGALASYATLIEKCPNSPLTKRAALEKGMILYNENRDQEAIAAYKDVVNKYPNSEEAKTALESMEQIYVDNNDVSTYFNYARSISNQIVTTDATREDSLTYLAAERLYMKGDTVKAISALETYTNNFCSGTISKNCLNASYYLADCYFSKGKKDDAFKIYDQLTQMAGNPFMETALVRKAQIAYDNEDYETAGNTFIRLEKEAQERENVTAAKIGQLRCNYLENDAQGTIETANKIINDGKMTNDVKFEAKYYLAKSYLQTDQYDAALPLLKDLGKNTKDVFGAEAQYELANTYYIKGDDKKAEKIVTEYIERGTPHHYWLARGFILLSDVYIKRGDDFQAKQYLLSLKENYKTEDSIQDLIAERLDNIAQREKEQIE